MRKFYCFLIIGFIILLSACGDAESTKTDEDKKVMNEKVEQLIRNNTDTEQDLESEDKIKKLSLEEVEKIIAKHKQDTKNIKLQLKEKYSKKFFQQDWSRDRDDNGKEFQDAVSIVRDSLSKVMTKRLLDNVAESHTRAYFCQCDWNLTMFENVSSRLEIVSQSENQFQAKFISLGPLGISEQSGVMNKWGFRKENDLWKLDEKQSITPDEESLHLTFDDLQKAFGYKSDAFIEEVEYKANNYIVILNNNGFYEVWNVLDGSGNIELSKQYNSPEENTEDNSNVKNENNNNTDEFNYELTDEMIPFGGDWEQINNKKGNSGWIYSRPPAVEMGLKNKSRISGYIKVITENTAKFYNEETGCGLEMILKENETMKIVEASSCGKIGSSLEGFYDKTN